MRDPPQPFVASNVATMSHCDKDCDTCRNMRVAYPSIYLRCSHSITLSLSAELVASNGSVWLSGPGSRASESVRARRAWCLTGLREMRAGKGTAQRMSHSELALALKAPASLRHSGAGVSFSEARIRGQRMREALAARLLAPRRWAVAFGSYRRVLKVHETV